MFHFYGRVQGVCCCRDAATSLNLRQQTLIIQAFSHTACREPRGMELIGSESGRVSLTQEDNTVDEGELKPKMRKSLSLDCLFVFSESIPIQLECSCSALFWPLEFLAEGLTASNPPLEIFTAAQLC